MSNLAFEIGFDHYLFKLPLDIARFSDEHRRQIRYVMITIPILLRVF